MTNYEKLISDKERVARLLCTSEDHKLASDFYKWHYEHYCKELCPMRNECDGDCDCTDEETPLFEEMLAFLDAECQEEKEEEP